MNTRSAFLAWMGSIFAISAALYFQYFRGLDPCVLCQYQRVPHYIVIGLGWLAVWRLPILRPVFGLVMLAGAGIAMFHVGVEYGWWAGLSTCGGSTEAMSAEALLDIAPAKCDEVAWSLFGLSMAAWNGLLSFLLAWFWFTSFRKVA